MKYVHTTNGWQLRVFSCECGCRHEISMNIFRRRYNHASFSMGCVCGRVYGLKDYKTAFRNREGKEIFVGHPDYYEG